MPRERDPRESDIERQVGIINTNMQVIVGALSTNRNKIDDFQAVRVLSIAIPLGKPPKAGQTVTCQFCGNQISHMCIAHICRCDGYQDICMNIHNRYMGNLPPDSQSEVSNEGSFLLALVGKLGANISRKSRLQTLHVIACCIHAINLSRHHSGMSHDAIVRQAMHM